MFLREKARRLLILIPITGLICGLVLQHAGQPDLAEGAWFVATIPVLLWLVLDGLNALRHGEFGIDLLAALSMTGALAFGEPLAAAIVALMYASGNYLEIIADRRARREMTELLARAPRTTLRYFDGKTEEINVEDIVPGDRLLVRQGDVIPVDGGLLSSIAVVDQSALTGEAQPVRYVPGGELLSGTTNAGNAFEMLASRYAKESTYAGIVRLVKEAQTRKAPMARMADRYALLFLAATLISVAATWSLTGDPLRVVAVLVVATPCPLILAVPVALISGLSCAARHGILMKGGNVIEKISKVRTLVIDKTGTLTIGKPELTAVHASDRFDGNELLRLAASLDRFSKHPTAMALVDAASARGLDLSQPARVSEEPGDGIEGIVDTHSVALGGRRYVAKQIQSEKEDLSTGSFEVPAGTSVVNIAINGRLEGHFLLADTVRPDAHIVFDSLRKNGLQRVILATGDVEDTAQHMATGLGIDAIRSSLTPDQKVLTVLSERKNGPVMMVGDGVNDAPALAAADIGVAMGARGAAASAEAADAVLLLDELQLLVPAFAIAQRTMRIAYGSSLAGMFMSLVSMAFAAAGYLTPVMGALLQELIDLAVVINALRALSIRDQTLTPSERHSIR